MLVRCDGEEDEEDDGDDEGSERLLKGLSHQCSLALQVQGLPTGYCRDIHGQVCIYVFVQCVKSQPGFCFYYVYIYVY